MGEHQPYNRLCVNAVHLRYPRLALGQLYGFIVSDDHEQYEVLDLPSEAQIPDTLEGFLRHCLDQGHTAVWDLLAEHAAAEAGVRFDGNYTGSEELARLLDAVAGDGEDA